MNTHADHDGDALDGEIQPVGVAGQSLTAGRQVPFAPDVNIAQQAHVPSTPPPANAFGQPQPPPMGTPAQTELLLADLHMAQYTPGTLDEAMAPIFALQLINDAAEQSLRQMMTDAIKESTPRARRNKKLTPDQCAAIYVYTCDSALYRQLNAVMRSGNRQDFEPYIAFAQLLLSALHKLPLVNDGNFLTVYRGIPEEVVHSQQQTVLWPAFGSSSTIAARAELFMRRGGGGGPAGTLFHATVQHAVDITSFSYNPHEKEVLILPGTKFEVEMVPGLPSINQQLKEIKIMGPKPDYMHPDYTGKQVHPANGNIQEQRQLNVSKLLLPGFICLLSVALVYFFPIQSDHTDSASLIDKSVNFPQINRTSHLDQIGFALRIGHRVVISGPSGSGKSVLARQYATMVHAENLLVWTLECQSVTSIEASWSLLALSIGLLPQYAKIPSINNSLQIAIRSKLLSKKSSLSILFVFENVPDQSYFNKNLAQSWDFQNTDYIITTCSRTWTEYIAVVELEGFDLNQSRMFITVMFPYIRIDQLDFMHLLSQGHPLVLTQMIGCCLMMDSVESCLKSLRDMGYLLEKSATFANYENTGRIIGQMMAEVLRNQNRTLSLSILDMMSVLGRIPISRDILRSRLAKYDIEQINAALKVCLNVGMLNEVEININGARELAYQMQATTALFYSTNMMSEWRREKAAQDWARHFIHAFETRNTITLSGVSKLLQILPHGVHFASVWSTRAHEHSPKRHALLELGLNLTYDVSSVCLERLALVETGLILANQSLMLASTIQPSDGGRYFHIARAHELFGMASALLSNFNESLLHYEKSLAIRLASTGPKNADTVNCNTKIGLIYLSQRDFKKSLKYFEIPCEERLDVPDPWCLRVTAERYNNIGTVYLRNGEFDKAIAYHEKSLAMCISSYGSHHFETATRYHNIGIVYYSRGLNSKAIEFLAKALTVRLATLGNTHPDTASSYSSIGDAHYNASRNDQALDYYEKSLAIRLAILGPTHPDTAESYSEIARLYYRKNEYDNAIEYHEKSLSIYLLAFGHEHSEQAARFDDTGDAYYGKGDYVKALEHYKKSLDIRLATLGPDHPDTAKSNRNLGSTLLAAVFL